MSHESTLEQPSAPGRHRHQLAWLWAGAALALLALAPLGPWLAAQLWACPFKELTGIPCPGCGTTRAALHLARFEIFESLVRYPLQTLAWMFFIGGGLIAGILALLDRDLPSLSRRPPKWLTAMVVLTLLANWAWSIVTGV